MLVICWFIVLEMMDILSPLCLPTPLIKYLGINLTKEVDDLYKEMFKTLKKKKRNLRRHYMMERSSVMRDGQK